MITRSNRIEVRNPIVGLSVFARLQVLPAPIRKALADLLFELGAEARLKANKCWTTHKAPMAVYWKAVSVYSRHIARALKKEAA